MGSYSVVQCVRRLMGQPLYYSAANAGMWGERGYGYVPGATTGDPTHDKVMWKRTVEQGFRTQRAP